MSSFRTDNVPKYKKKKKSDTQSLQNGDKTNSEMVYILGIHTIIIITV